MPTASLGDLRQRMAAVWQEANASGHKPEDVIPSEMQDHFQNLAELKTVKEYVKQVEEREKILKEENEKLAKELQVQKKKVEELPDDHKQLIVDHQQLENRAKFYQELMNRAEERVEDYQNRWKAAQKMQIVAEGKEQKLADLERESENQKSIIIKLIEENRTARELFEELQEKGENATKQKDIQLAAMERFVVETEERYQNLEEESEGFEQTYAALMERMENENGDTAAALNNMSQKIRHSEQLKMAAVSEAKTLSKFYHRAFQILLIYQRTFQKLLSLRENKVTWLPDDLRPALSAAQKECEAYETIHEMVGFEGLEEDEIRAELGVLARSARLTQDSLKDIAGDLEIFLKTLGQRPDLWTFLKSRLDNPMKK